MYKRVTVTIPENLFKLIEKERKKLNLNRSELIRKSIRTFFWLDSKIDKCLIKKYGPIYETLNKESIEITDEMLDSKTNI